MISQISWTESSVVVHTYNSNTWKVEAGKWRIWGQPWLHSKFKTSLGYIMDPVSKTNKQTENTKNYHKLYCCYCFNVLNSYGEVLNRTYYSGPLHPWILPLRGAECPGAGLYSQYLGGWGRRILSSGWAWNTPARPCFKEKFDVHL